MKGTAFPGMINTAQIVKMNKLEEELLKTSFSKEINGDFLNSIKKRVQKRIQKSIPQLFADPLSHESFITGCYDIPGYEICKTIIGVHHANMVFVPKEEESAIISNSEYKKQLTLQVVSSLQLRQYSAVFFRRKTYRTGERFIYYPVPYLLFVLCVRADEIITSLTNTIDDPTIGFLIRIVNKALAALALLEDNYLDSAYIPCRTAIEAYYTYKIIARNPEAYNEWEKHAQYDLHKTVVDQQYSGDFLKAFENRKNKADNNKIGFMHYGFVDAIDEYIENVPYNTYSIIGLNHFFTTYADKKNEKQHNLLKFLYNNCNGYTHGNVYALYPILNYLEVSMILGLIVPECYLSLCRIYSVETTINGIDVVEKFTEEFTILKEQYREITTEKLESESKKYYPISQNEKP